jgi:hypothetical protein
MQQGQQQVWKHTGFAQQSHNPEFHWPYMLNYNSFESAPAETWSKARVFGFIVMRIVLSVDAVVCRLMLLLVDAVVNFDD